MDDSILTPSQMVELAAKGAGLSVAEFGIAPVVVGSWGYGLVRHMAQSVGAERLEHAMHGERHPVYSGEIDGHAVSFAHYPMGAAGTVMLMEELAALGARAFLTLGWAGSLQSDLPIGSAVLPMGVVSEEGTSAHYEGGTGVSVPAEDAVAAVAAAAAAADVDLRKGVVWSTDAPYRETRTKVQRYAADGVLGVDMETAGMLSFGRFRGVSVCNLLIISDELGDEWKPGFADPRHMSGTMEAVSILLGAAGALAAQFP